MALPLRSVPIVIKEFVIFEKASHYVKDILVKVSEYVVSNDAKDILREIHDDGDNIFEKVSDVANLILKTSLG